jgi:cobalt-zinc-cadmium efflux system membrane fusion protein
VSHVFSPVNGRVTKIEAQLGDKVKKGAALATIMSPDLSQASSDYDKAIADEIAAQHDYNRKKELADAHAGSLADLEAAEDNFRKAKAEVSRAKQKNALLRGGSVVSDGFMLRSLIDGEVISRAVNIGQEINGQYSGGSAVELFTIGDVNQVWIMADVFEMDLPRVKTGAKVTVKVVAYPDQKFEGVVDWVSGALDANTRTAKVRCVVPNLDHKLKPEMYATVSIGVNGRKALSVKRSALLHMGDVTEVFVQTGDAPKGMVRFEQRPVVVDEDEDGDYLPVSSGLKPGEQVVTKNAILLTGS